MNYVYVFYEINEFSAIDIILINFNHWSEFFKHLDFLTNAALYTTVRQYYTNT